MSTLSVGIPLPNSLWTGSVSTGYFPSQTLRWSYLLKREKWGWKCFPIPERPCGKVHKRSTASLTQSHCQSLHWLPIPIKRRASRWREGQAFTHSSSFNKMSIRPELSWKVNWPRKHRSWFIIMMINRSNWPGSMRDGKHGWLRRLMPPFRKSSPSQSQPTQLSCCLGMSPAQFPFAVIPPC